MVDLQQHIRHLVINRHTPEAMELYTLMMQYIHRRIQKTSNRSGSGRFSPAEVEDLVSEVMVQLINGSLVQFRGETLPELFAYIRTITDRRIWRTRTKSIKDRDLLQRFFESDEAHHAMNPTQPDAFVDFNKESCLSDDDENYIKALLSAGSKAEYARRHNQSRAAVTQRVRRIVKRIETLTDSEQMAVQSWLNRMARQSIGETCEGFAATFRETPRLLSD